MSTKQALRYASEAKAATKLTVEDLKAEAKALGLKGYSALKREDLEKAVRTAKAKSASKARVAKPAPESNGNTPATKGKGTSKKAELVSEVTFSDGVTIHIGDKVRFLNNVDLSGRSEGFAGQVEKGWTGKVVAFKGVGKSFQATVESKEADAPISLGVRHLELV